MAIDNRKYHFIYKTINLLNNKFYIGLHSTNNLDDGYMGSGDRIRSSIRHYGKKNHKLEILEFLDSRESLMLREKEIVNFELLKDPLCLNIMQGGSGFYDVDHFKKVCQAGNLAFKEKLKDEKYREGFKQKTKENLKKAHLKSKELYERGEFKLDTFSGKKHTPEALEKMRSADRTGKKNSQFGTYWVYHQDFGPKKIKTEEFEAYNLKGWKRGRSSETFLEKGI
jgi:hypothetical protein